MKNYCILIPSLIPTGPVKGAIALANALADKRSVKLVTLKEGSQWKVSLDPRVEIICLQNNSKNWISIYNEYCQILNDFGGRESVVSLSMCFSADALNSFCKKHAKIVSSIRANNLVNYYTTYGILGILLLYIHNLILRRFDNIWVLSKAMANQVESFHLKAGNFIDEREVKFYRKKYTVNHKFKFIFIGSLIKRKQPLLLLEAFKLLHDAGHEIHLDIVGTGPLEKKVKSFIHKNNLSDSIYFHGQLNEPYNLLASSDAFVLPSLSEGISRAAMEALFLGVPCILRDSDGNGELINVGLNGVLFKENINLSAAMTAVIEHRMRRRECILPVGFRQEEEVSKILTFLER